MSDLRSRIAGWLDALPEERRRGLARSYAEDLFRRGLAVYKGDEDRFVPIAPSLSPEPIADGKLAELSRHARLILTAISKAARWTLTDARLSRRLYHGFTEIERACLGDRLEQIATARVDYFWRGPVPQALELNATIPAMQGYSDIAAHGWLRHVGAELGVSNVDELIAANGSNTADLLAALVEWYQKLGGREAKPSILIVSRRADSQLGELRHYERAFTEAGHRTRHVWVDEVEVDSQGGLRARGEPFELLYRHVFARKVPPDSTLGRLLVDPKKTIILNPVVSPLEVKGVLGLLSATRHDDALAEKLGLDADERNTITFAVPWTRLLDPGPATTPDGARSEDLPAWVAEHGSRLVIKRSWDYGGKGVVLGPEAGAEWPALVARAAADENAWVVQELVPPIPVTHMLVIGGETTWQDVFVDVNAYTNLGVSARPRGGVCRASGSKIVNIALGGGVAPLIRSSILEKLFP